MRLFGGRGRPQLAERTTLTVLGMHRSGTSAVAGMLAEQGVELGPVSEQNRFNPRGNREIQELNRVHDRVLERSGGSWWQPPDRVRIRRSDLRRRNEILERITGTTVGVKDPRMLLLLEMWEDLEPKPIGVVRNPVAVRASLERRAHERPRRHPQLSSAEWEQLWLTYNRILLAERRRREFPLIDFDRADDLGDQVRRALSFWGIEATEESRFYASELTAGSNEDWRAEATAPEVVALYEELSSLASA
jgi:hypothetical protein